MTVETGLRPSEPRVVFGFFNSRQFCRRFPNWEVMSAWMNQKTYRGTFAFVQVVSLRTWEA